MGRPDGHGAAVKERPRRPGEPHPIRARVAIARIETVMRDRQHERDCAFAAELEAWKDKHADPFPLEPSLPSRTPLAEAVLRPPDHFLGLAGFGACVQQ